MKAMPARRARFISIGSALAAFAMPLLAARAQDSSKPADAPPAPAVQRFLYSGSVGPKLRVVMELSAPGEEMTGSYFYSRVGEAIDLAGASAADGSIKLDETIQGAATGQFRGKLLDGGARIEGEWSDPEGKRKLPFELRRSAEFISEERERNDKMTGYKASIAYPRFTLADPKRTETLNAYVKQAVMGRIDGTEADLKEAAKGLAQEDVDRFPPATHWEIDISATDVRFVSEGFVSLAVGEWSYTGGAHGNGGTTGYNLKIGDKIEPVALGALFKPGSDWLAALSDLLIADLKRQEAADVVSGEIKAFGARDLGSFTMTEAGFHFYFNPYTVGPYVQGAFDVDVPFKALADRLDQAKLRRLIVEPALPSPVKRGE